MEPKKNRFFYFRRTLDFLLSKIWLIVVFLFIALLVAAIVLLTEILPFISEEARSTIQAVATSMIAALFLSLIVSVPKMRSWMRRLKRACFKKIKKQYDNSESRSFKRRFWGYWIGVLNLHISPSTSQREASDKILEHLAAGHSRKRIYCLRGPRFSGKTTVIVHLLVSIATSEEWCSIFEAVDRKIRYYDFSRAGIDSCKVSEGIRGGSLDRDLVIFENIHKMPNRCLLDFLTDIDASEIYAAIVTTRDLDEISDQDFSTEHLKSFMKDRAVELDLSDLLTDEQIKRNLRSSQFPLAKPSSYADMHTASIDQNFTIAQNFMRCMVGEEVDGGEKELFVALISGCMFSGSVQESDLGAMVQNLDLKKSLQELCDSHVIRKCLDDNGRYYELHEALAESYALNTYNANKELYRRSFSILLRSRSHDPVQQMLFSKLLDKDGESRAYDQAFNEASFSVLRQKFDFIIELDPECKEHCYRERGIVFDRLGKLQKATEQYVLYYQNHQTADALLKAVQTDHALYPRYEDEIDRFCVAPGAAYDRLLARYWRIHMEMHQGVFSFEKMSELIDELSDNARDIVMQEPYSGLHLLRRAFFDYFRMYYLCGVLDGGKLRAGKEDCISKILADLPEYQAYADKFISGHYLHYDVLFRIGSLGESIEKDEIATVLRRYGYCFENIAVTCEGVAQAALAEYKKAYERMERFGDKTVYFVKCRYYEVEVALGKYDAAESFYSSFMKFADQEDNDYYRGCACFYQAKLMFAKRFDCRNIQSASCENDESIKEKLECAREFFDKADPDNPYIEVNMRIYQILLKNLVDSSDLEKTVLNKNLRTSLAELKTRSDEMGYSRQSRLVERLAEKADENLSFYDCAEIMRYYPFVAQ